MIALAAWISGSMAAIRVPLPVRRSRNPLSDSPPLPPPLCAAEDLATAYAEYLSKTFDANVEMDGEHTLRTLRTWGLVKQATDGAWLAIPAERAEEALGRVWNDLYTYKPVGLEEGSAW